jgi:hypothetical protein
VFEKKKFDVKRRYLKLSKLWVFIDPILKVWLELMVPLFYAFQEVQVAYVLHYSISKEGDPSSAPDFGQGRQVLAVYPGTTALYRATVASHRKVTS